MIARFLLVPLLLIGVSASAADGFAVYSRNDVPKACRELGPVTYEQSFNKDSPEYRVAGGELKTRFLEKCKGLAMEKGANALLNQGVSHFHGKGFFGYSCQGVALQC